MRALNRLFIRLLNFTTRRRGDERLREEIESLPEEASFLEAGIIDSTGVLEIIGAANGQPTQRPDWGA